MRVFVVTLLVAMACTNPPASSGGAAPASGADTVAEAATAPQETMVVTTGPRVTFPDGFVVRVEIAADDESRAQGLMFRDRLDPGTGMLFLFSHDEELRFWMKNTRIPLDMIFIDVNRRIVDIQHSVPPCRFDPCPSYGAPGVLSRYVLEVAGGEARKHSLKNGDVLKFEGTEDVVVR